MDRAFRKHHRGVTPKFFVVPRTFFQRTTGDSMHSPIISTTQCRGSSERTRAALARNTRIYNTDELPPPPCRKPEFTPTPPVVAGALLSGEQLSFLEFLYDSAAADYCALLLGSRGTAAAKMLRELRNATEFHYFGYWRGKPGSKNPHSSGKLTAPAAKTKKLLKKYARRAYRGDEERRGVIFWQRTAWLIWNCYATLMALRHRAETIKQQDIKRISQPAGQAGGAGQNTCAPTVPSGAPYSAPKPHISRRMKQRRHGANSALKPAKEKPNEYRIHAGE